MNIQRAIGSAEVQALAVALLLLAMAGGSLAGTHASTRIYVTNSLGDDISVIDVSTRKVIGDIRVGEHVHGVCARADGQVVFATIESEKALKVIDTATDEVVDTIALTGTPNQCASTPDGHFVVVPIRDGNSADIVDMEEKKVVKVLPVSSPHNSYNAGDDRRIWVSSLAGHQIDLIDLTKMDFAEKISVGGVPRPYAVSRDGKWLYVALSDLHGFVVVSIADEKVIERVDLPPAPPSACALEPHTPTHGIELTPDGSQLWVTSLADGGVYVYDIATKQLSREIPTGKCPNWITVTPDGRYAAVSNSSSDDCSIIDVRTHLEVARVKVGRGPKRLLALTVP